MKGHYEREYQSLSRELARLGYRLLPSVTDAGDIAEYELVKVEVLGLVSVDSPPDWTTRVRGLPGAWYVVLPGVGEAAARRLPGVFTTRRAAVMALLAATQEPQKKGA